MKRARPRAAYIFGMTNISASAEAARESARADNGQFAPQERSAPDVSLDGHFATVSSDGEPRALHEASGKRSEPAAAAGEYSPELMARHATLDAQMAAICAARCRSRIHGRQRRRDTSPKLPLHRPRQSAERTSSLSNQGIAPTL